MNLFFPLLGLGITGAGIFAGVLQQNLSQTEKPYIDFLFEEIVKEIRKFAKENPINKEDFKNINCADSEEGDAREDCKKTIEASIKEINSELNSSELPQYTFQSLTDIWMGLLSGYISWWYDKSNKWGNSKQSNLNVNKKFTEENKEESFKEAEKSVKEEKKHLKKN